MITQHITEESIGGKKQGEDKLDRETKEKEYEVMQKREESIKLSEVKEPDKDLVSIYM